MSATPGPWVVDRDRIATVETAPPTMEGLNLWAVAFASRQREEWEANARLIAAAPELLAKVNAAADTFADFALMFKVLGKPLMVDGCRIAEESMRAAIARATAPTTEGAAK